MPPNTSPRPWRVLLAALLAASVVTGCGTDTQPSESDTTEGPAVTETEANEEFPPGSYEKTATREEALAEGVPAEILDRPDEFLGIDAFHITHTFHDDGRFEQSANYAGGSSVGDRGRYEIDADGRLVKHHDSGDVTVFDWSFADGVLTLEVHPDGGDYAERSEVDQAIARFYDAGVYRQLT